MDRERLTDGQAFRLLKLIRAAKNTYCPLLKFWMHISPTSTKSETSLKGKHGCNPWDQKKNIGMSSSQVHLQTYIDNNALNKIKYLSSSCLKSSYPFCLMLYSLHCIHHLLSYNLHGSCQAEPY